jgi:prolyl-tRNA synthetase
MAAKITPRAKDYSQWYVDIVLRARLADYSPVKGCMVIRPRGYALWERIREVLDGKFKATGHANAYFPMLIPESFINKEAEHIEGFSPELAVVTHAGGEELEEPLVLRPTSETIIWAMYKKWIQSYRDLPILINQWANVIRWEKRTRLFLRTTEFLWQEGHTAHETEAEAVEETLKILDLYKDFVENYMAIPVLTGKKSEQEKFAGAISTYAIEAMMQDRRALQAGTSHFLGQNFAKAFDVTYQTKNGDLDHVWATSWGVSTRLVGALIMTHSDDKGLVVPPKLASTEAVIIPIFKNDTRDAVLAYAEGIKEDLEGVKVELDDDDQNSPGWKFAEWEMLGVPVRIEIGPRDMESGNAVVVRRDTGEKVIVPKDEIRATVERLLVEIQQNLFDRAKAFRDENTHEIDDYEVFKKLFGAGERSGEGADDSKGGFAVSPWCGDAACETKIKDDTKATIRVLRDEEASGTCIACGEKSTETAVFAKAY